MNIFNHFMTINPMPGMLFLLMLAAFIAIVPVLVLYLYIEWGVYNEQKNIEEQIELYYKIQSYLS